MIEVVSNCIHDFFLLFVPFFDRFFGSNVLATKYLIPGFAIGLGISAIFLAVKLIKKIVWGS